MGFPRRLALVSAIAVTTFLAGCDRSSTSSSGAYTPVAVDLSQANATIAQPAWLRDRLPEHTVAYARIPSLWGMLSAPNGRALDPALASPAHIDAVKAIRAALIKDPALADTGMAPALTLLLDELAGPLELAIVDSSDIANPASSVFATSELRIADVAALNARLTSLGASGLLKAPLDANGKGALQGTGFLHFDAATRRLHILYGMTATAAGLDAVEKQLGQTRTHPVQAIEQANDRSGQGLFFWMSLKGVAGMAASQLPAAAPGSVVRDFIDRVQSVSFGWGTSNGRGKLQLQLAAADARLLGYLAPGQFKAAIKTAGKPRWAVTLALPSAAQMAALETNLDKDFGAGTLAGYQKGMVEMKAKLGMDLKDLIGLAGPDLIGFEDAAGTYSALRVADRAALYARLDELGKRFKWKHETVDANGTPVHHLVIPGIDLSAGATEDKAVTGWMALYSRLGSHLYWTEEGEYLIFGQVPQALADRAAASRDVDLGDWLRNSQGYDPSTVLIGATGTTRDVQRKVYYAYLSGLQTLADAVGQPINLAAMPNAAALKLPTDGATGIALEVTRERVGFSVVYDQVPGDVLFSSGGSMATVATLGILAAVAMPAYQDYVVRSQVSQVVLDASSLKLAVSESYQTTDKLPDNDEFVDFEFGPSAKYLDSFYVESGAIVLTFGDQADTRLAGSTLVLKPYLVDGSLQWQCAEGHIDPAAEAISATVETSSVADKYLPSSCK